MGRVDQGWIASTGENTSFSEAVVVHFDEHQIDLDTLIEMHLKTHSSTSDHSMRSKYRSAVYVFSEGQHRIVADILAGLQAKFDRPLIIRVLPHAAFKLNQKKYINYYYSNPDRPFCKNIIVEKVKLIEDQFREFVRAVPDV